MDGKDTNVIFRFNQNRVWKVIRNSSTSHLLIGSIDFMIEYDIFDRIADLLLDFLLYKIAYKFYGLNIL